MLGTHFDLSKTVAAIAAKREIETSEPAQAKDAFADVDQKLADFLRSIAPDAFSDQSSLIDLTRRPFDKLR